MPTIKRFENSRIEIRTNDHPPPHFHVVTRDRRDNLVQIEDGEMRGPIPERELAEVLAWAAENRTLLLTEWRKWHS